MAADQKRKISYAKYKEIENQRYLDALKAATDPEKGMIHARLPAWAQRRFMADMERENKPVTPSKSFVDLVGKRPERDYVHISERAREDVGALAGVRRTNAGRGHFRLE